MTITHGIVLGAPRSGTTFLMGALDTLPDCECLSGNLLPVGIAQLAGEQLPDEVREALARSLRGAFVDYMESSAYRSRSAALRKWWIASRSPLGLRAAAQGRRSESIVVYKEPFLALAPAFAFDALPGSRLIYLFRDGRDVADSLVRTYDVLSDDKLADTASNETILGRRVGDLYVPAWVAAGEEQQFLKASQYVRAVWMWREMTRRCQAFLARADVAASKRVLPVRYEQLMADPIAQGRKIATHLRQPMTARMRQRLADAHSRSVAIHTRRDPQEIAAAEALAGAELVELGYTLAVSRT
jgi:uncharacterized membrane protein